MSEASPASVLPRPSCYRCTHWWHRRGLCVAAVPSPQPGRHWDHPAVRPAWCPGYEAEPKCHNCGRDLSGPVTDAVTDGQECRWCLVLVELDGADLVHVGAGRNRTGAALVLVRSVAEQSKEHAIRIAAAAAVDLLEGRVGASAEAGELDPQVGHPVTWRGQPGTIIEVRGCSTYLISVAGETHVVDYVELELARLVRCPHGNEWYEPPPKGVAAIGCGLCDEVTEAGELATSEEALSDLNAVRAALRPCDVCGKDGGDCCDRGPTKADIILTIRNVLGGTDD